MAWNGKQYTVTATATSLTTALGLSKSIFIKQADFRADAANTGSVFLGKSNVTNVPANAFVVIATVDNGTEVVGESYSIVPGGNMWNVNTDEVYIVGTDDDILYIVVID